MAPRCAIRRVREHSRQCTSLETRAFLIRVERRLMAFLMSEEEDPAPSWPGMPDLAAE